MARRSGTDRQSNPFREDTVKEVWNKGKAISGVTDSKTYITGWTGNQGNKRKLKDFAVRNAKKYEQSS